MRISHFARDSYVDGPGGPRTALYIAGCTRHCPGCQNPHLWPLDSGEEVPVLLLAYMLVATRQPITVTGGEPFEQAGLLNVLLEAVKRHDPNRHVVVYTGYTWETLVSSRRGFFDYSSILQALANIDVLVDGPYIASMDHDGIQWRGSSNQRVIDVQTSLATGEIVLEDWDIPTLIVTDEGDLLGAADLIDELTPEGVTTRRCGECATFEEVAR